MKIEILTQDAKKDILKNLLKRSPSQYTEYEARVSSILSDVRENGDEAVNRYTEKFDGARIDSSNIAVTSEEFEEAYREVDAKLIEVMRKTRARIVYYHEAEAEQLV